MWILRVCIVCLLLVSDMLGARGAQFDFPTDRINNRLTGSSILILTLMDLGACANLCMSLTECVSVNYHMMTKCCELNNMTITDPSSETLQPSPDVVFLDIADWALMIASPCASKPCGNKHRCVAISTSWTCIYIGDLSNLIGNGDITNCAEPAPSVEPSSAFESSITPMSSTVSLLEASYTPTASISQTASASASSFPEPSAIISSADPTASSTL